MLSVLRRARRARTGRRGFSLVELLAVLIDSPAALAHDPMLVKRLHRMRDARAQARVSRSLGPTD